MGMHINRRLDIVLSLTDSSPPYVGDLVCKYVVYVTE